ncbi:MAG TPA: imidazole glycerol phosphate synthase subunit HisH [Saprospiraceae bacterium]|nr:imidazole glycerol phosphate synthase subunit HisH [Saprospiraceae bacterium]
MIAILDYKMGNVQSIVNMFKKIGVLAKVTADPIAIKDAEKLILPGVGYFDYAMQNLRATPYFSLLNELVLEQKRPILGICLGAQLMLDGSEEGEPTPGLSWIKGKVVKFKIADHGLRVPHMGWNDVVIHKESNLVRMLPEEPRFYFVHSYYLDVAQEADILLTTDYGLPFTSAFSRDNIYGVQFHPEKSHKFGMQLLKNFAQL